MDTEAAKNAEDIKRDAADLYLLAFLLTGRADVSIDIAAEAAVSEDHPTPFFAEWMRDWRRRLVIGKALSAVREELAASARQVQRMHVGASTLRRNRPTPSRAGQAEATQADLTKADLDRALLAMDLFPRAAVLLLIFEHMRMADVAALLDADPALLKKAQAIGMQELTANLAGANGLVSGGDHGQLSSVLI